MTRQSSFASHRIAAGCCLLVAASGVSAATFTAAVSSSSGNINIGGPTNEDFRQDAFAAAASSSSTSTERNVLGNSDGLGTAGASAWSTSAPGSMRLLTQADAHIVSTNGGGALGQGTASADTSINDSFVVLANGCVVAANCGVGAIGTMTFSIRFDAGFLGGGDYHTSTPEGGTGGYSLFGEWNSGGQVGSGIDGATWLRGAHAELHQSGDPMLSSTNGGAGLQTFTIAFTFGTPVSLSMTAHAVAQAGAIFDFYASQDGNGGSSANAGYATDMSHTIAWNGISAVRDADGALISSFGAFSADTGYDYAQAFAAPVPEPETWALMAAGIAALRLYRRRVGRHA